MTAQDWTTLLLTQLDPTPFTEAVETEEYLQAGKDWAELEAAAIATDS